MAPIASQHPVPQPCSKRKGTFLGRLALKFFFAPLQRLRITRYLARRLGLEFLPVCFNGKWLHIPVETWDGYVQNYEPKVAAVLREHLKPGDSFVDVGSHNGMWSLFAASLTGTCGMVIGCEPSPAFDFFKKISAEKPHIVPLKVGLGKEDSEALFFAQGGEMTGSFVQDVTDLNRSLQPDIPIETKKVKIRSIDSLILEYKLSPRIIKVDVEGFELEVLKGASTSLKELSALWIVEIHPPQLSLSGGTEDDIFKILKQNGYLTEIVNRDDNSIYTVVAHK